MKTAKREELYTDKLVRLLELGVIGEGDILDSSLKTKAVEKKNLKEAKATGKA
jgi:hypothetical protein